MAERLNAPAAPESGIMRGMDREERGIRSTDPGPDLSQLRRWELEAARDKAAGRLHVLEGIDQAEHLAEPSPATRAAQRDLETIKAAIVELARREGRPLRPIDTATFVGGRIREEPWRPENVHVEQGALLRYEFEPCPSWMAPARYASLLAKLVELMKAGPVKPTKLAVWTARHIHEVREAPKLVSHDASRSAIGAALEIAYRAKKAGMLEELGLPVRRRLSDILWEGAYADPDVMGPAISGSTPSVPVDTVEGPRARRALP